MSLAGDVDGPALSELLVQSRSRSPSERDGLIYEAYRRYGKSMTAIGKALGLHKSTLNRMSNTKKYSSCRIQDPPLFSSSRLSDIQPFLFTGVRDVQ